MKRLSRLLLLCGLLGLIGVALFQLGPRPGNPVPPPDDLPALVGAVDLIRIEKAARRLSLIQNDQVLRRYSIALGFSPTGDKVKQGDGRTPEGQFKIDRRNAQSAYTLSLGLNYPRPEDRARAKKGGYDPGGDIMIHGQPNALPADYVVSYDWTAGCIALSNAQMRLLWAHVPIGTRVEILP